MATSQITDSRGTVKLPGITIAFQLYAVYTNKKISKDIHMTEITKKVGRPKGSTGVKKITERLMIYLPPELAQKARQTAKERNQTITGFFEEILLNELKRQNIIILLIFLLTNKLNRSIVFSTKGNKRRKHYDYRTHVDEPIHWKRCP